MAIKPTAIGDTSAGSPGRIAPTRLGDAAAGPPASSTSTRTVDSGRIGPTRLASPAAGSAGVPDVRGVPGAQSVPVGSPSRRATPTAIPQRTAASAPLARAPVPAPAAPVAPSAPVAATALPGQQRKPLEVSLETLAARFPGADEPTLNRVQSVLRGVVPEALTSAACLAFGKASQEELAKLVKQRLALTQEAPTRGAIQHLTRMHRLLGEVVDAMDGGFLKKPATRVWVDVSPELAQLESLLTGAELGVALGTQDALVQKARACSEDLQAASLAAEFLAEGGEERVAQLLTPRALSLTQSVALALEQIQALEVEKARTRELMTLVQDGVLVQLPAVYSQMAALAAQPTDTQRFVAREKLGDLMTFIHRKL